MKIKIEEVIRACLRLTLIAHRPPRPTPQSWLLTTGVGGWEGPSRKHPIPGGRLAGPRQTVPCSSSPVLTQDHQTLGVHLVLGPVGSGDRTVGRGQKLLRQQGPHHVGAQHWPAVLRDLEDEPEEAGEWSLPGAGGSERGWGRSLECGSHPAPCSWWELEGDGNCGSCDGRGARHPFSSSRGNLTPSEGGALERPTHFTDEETEA